MTKEKLFEEIRGIRRIVINECHGGFGLSAKAQDKYKELTGITDKDFYVERDVARDDPYLVQIVRELGQEAAGRYAQLKIVEVPADVDWTIDEYDGREWVAERHRTWQ